MGVLSAIPNALGVGSQPGQKELDEFSAQAAKESERLRRFKPFRTTSAFGTQRFFQEDGETQFSTESSLLNDAISRFEGASEGGSDKVLALLRQQAAPEFDRQFGRLEARSLAQGRLGLSTGDRGSNPEFESFFGARQQADLGFQLQALEESRRQRKSLFSEMSGIQGLLSGQFSDLLGAEQLQSSREIAAGNLFGASSIAGLQGQLGLAESERSLFGGAVSSLGVGPFSASF